MRSIGFLARIPGQYLMPVVLLITLTAIYVQETSLLAIWITLGFLVLSVLALALLSRPSR